MSGKDCEGSARAVPVAEVLRNLVRHPVDMVVRRWNWKAALLSALIRGAIFFCVNLLAGPRAALAALMTELMFRGVISGFYGALTESFRFAEPEWAASLAALILLPLAGHSLEFVVHFLRGTAKLGASIFASVCFTGISTLFNLYAMRRGALVTGVGRQSLGDDMKRMPGLVIGFVAAGPIALGRLATRKLAGGSRSSLGVAAAPEGGSD